MFKCATKIGKKLLKLMQKKFEPVNIIYSVDKETKIYGWMDLIYSKINFPFSLCEDQNFLKYSKLEKISTPTLLKYSYLAVKTVENKITKNRPEKGGILFDRWSDNGTHYIGGFCLHKFYSNVFASACYSFERRGFECTIAL